MSDSTTVVEKVDVTTILFTNPRVKVKDVCPSFDNARMPDMLKWGPEKLQSLVIECVDITGDRDDDSKYAAAGVEANRVLYVLKKKDIKEISVKVVEVCVGVEINADSGKVQTYGRKHYDIQAVP